MRSSLQHQYFSVSPYWSPAPKDKQKRERICIKSISELNSVFSNWKGLMSFDYETTDLDPEKVKIVGFSFSFDGIIGYYVPINHEPIQKTSIENVPEKEALDIVMSFLSKSAVFLANAKFEFQITEIVAGYDCSKWRYWDVLILVWLLDSNVSMPSLKDSVAHFCGYFQATYEETIAQILPPDINPKRIKKAMSEIKFSMLPPELAFEYAADDAIGTFLLAQKTIPLITKECKYIAELDNSMAYIVYEMEKHKHRLDFKYLKKLSDRVQKEMDDIEDEICIITGRDKEKFNVNSPKQLAEALLEMNIDTGVYGKSGVMSVSASLLEKIDHPLTKKITYRNSIKTIHSTFIKKPLLWQSESSEYYNKVRVGFNINKTSTGRFSSSSQKNNTYYAPINIQNQPANKDDAEYWTVYDNKEDSILGWSFYKEKVSGSKKVIAGRNKINVRKAYLPLEDHYWVAIDFSSQEAIIAANLSKEKTWIDALLDNEDLHKNTALTMFGKVNKELRQIAKGINYGVLYGQEAKGLADKLNIPVQQAQRYLNKWKMTHPNLVKFQNFCIRQGRSTGSIYSAFKRPRRVQMYFESINWSDQSFAERTCKNSPIQATGSDIIKKSMQLLYEYLKDKSEKEIKMLMSIHDEIDLSIHKNNVIKNIEAIKTLMEFKIPGWVVPLSVDIEIGNSWGDLFKFYKNSDGKWIPETENE